MTRIVTKAMANQFIDGKCHTKKSKTRKTVLSSYYACVSCDLLLMPLGRGNTHTHTRTHTDVQTKAISRNQVHVPVAHAHGLKRKNWYSNIRQQQ